MWIFTRNRAAENLYSYSATDAIGKSVFKLLVTYRDAPYAEAIIQHCKMGETWTGKFSVTHKMGHMFTVFLINTPLYDDDGTFIGITCLLHDSRLFKKEEMGQEFSRLRNSATTKIDFERHQPLQTAIASKITDLAYKVSSKVRSKMKIGESNCLSDAMLSERREDGNCSGARTSRGDPADMPAGFFYSCATSKHTAHAQGDFIDDSDGKSGIRKLITSKVEAWIVKKAMRWSGKETECESSEPQSGRFGWPWVQSEQDSNRDPKSLRLRLLPIRNQSR